MMEGHENRMIQAKEVYVLMKKDYRISRNIRASWFFENLQKTLQFTCQENLVDTSDELQVASVLPANETECVPGKEYAVSLLPSTMVTFVARRYRFVIILDLSPSVSSVDTASYSVLYEKVHKTLANFLQGLVLPFCLPGSCAVLSPELHITVIAYTPVKTFTFNQVLVQGLIINGNNIQKIVDLLKQKLTEFETALAETFSKIVEEDRQHYTSSYFDVRPPAFPSDSSFLPKGADIVNNPEAGIVNMIRCGLLALHLLPENSSAGLVVITDGCLGVPDANLFEFLLTQLRTSTIACTFLRIGESRLPFGHFGHIPHTELMQFIATATFGSYFNSCPDVTGSAPNTLNAYHKAMFLWSFQRGLDGFRFDLGDHDLMAQQSSPAQLVQRLLSHPIHGKLASVMPNIRKKHSESTLNTSLFSVLSVRLREGYTIRDIAFTKGESQIEVRLVLPWREYARFEYLIRAAWPLDAKRHATFTETTIEGSYDFLHDMTCTKINTQTMSPFRSANVRKFWLALQGLSQTDQLLIHLQSFSSNSNNYTLPESIREGVPLFYLPQPTSTMPSLSTQLNSKDQVLNQFASFWRPVVNLDVKIWQKWTHTHRIGLVLEHDIPLHKNIHIPNSSGRFTMVMCRQALMSLNKFLSGWSTFVLLDNQSYIKLIFENAEEKNQPPTSFVLIRITSKAPCLVLRLAFLGGTPGYQRYELVKELKQKVSKLKFPQRGPKSDKNRRAAVLKKAEEKEVVKKAPLLREWSEVFCCVLLQKPVETILIRYERMPRDMTKVEESEKPTPSFMSQVQSKTKTAAINMYNSLARYLLHQRWIYTVQQPGVNSISMQGIGRILSTLTKMRIQEGFHFSLTNSGIVNMVLEVDMKDTESSVEYTSKTKQRPTCVVQYVMFPPHVKTTSDNLSDEEADEMDSPEDEGELQLITECWVEPQYGVAANNTPERRHWDDLMAEQITNTFHPLDLQCISSLLTFQHLMYLCQNCVIPADLSSIVNAKQGNKVTSFSKTVQHIAFPFDLLSILPRSQQAELIYPTFTCDVYNEHGDDPQYGKDANHLLFSLLNEELTDSSHRKVTLSTEQSCLFFNQINDRSRNTDINPLPFEISHFLATDKEESNKVHVSSASSQRSYATVNKTAEVPVSPDEPKTFPQWQCFIKAVSTNSLILTFVPASFEDIVLLHKRKESKEEIVEEGEDKTEADKEFEKLAQSETGQNVPVNAQKKYDGESAIERTNATAETRHETHETSDEAEGASASPTEDGDRDRSNNARRNYSGDSAGSDMPYGTPLKFPVYVYDCSTSNLLDSLINPWTFQLQADLYQDKRFDFQLETNEVQGPTYSPRQSKRVSFNLDTGKDEEDGTSRYSFRSLDRRSTEGSSEGGENLWQHYYSLSEMFYNCYVKGVFQGLQKGFPIKCQDVDAAINNICEESLPLETNITSFLHATCGHFQQFVNEVRKDNERLADQITETSEETARPVVRFDVTEDVDSDGEQRKPSVPNVLGLPHTTVTFDLSSLHLERPCELVRELHQLIRNKFQDIIQKWFRSVPSSPDYYFYCPERPMEQVEELSDGRETTASETVAGIGNTNTTTAVDTTALGVDNLKVVSELNASHDQSNKTASTVSTMDSEESVEDEEDLEFDMTDDKSDMLPLFVNFTCTVKSHLQQYSLSQKDIASCLGELATILENMSEIDLGDLKITFDLNCLTLPSDLESTSPRRPSCLRMLSYSSVGNQSSSSSENGDRASSSHLSDVKHLKDPIFHLPPIQHDAVNKCVEEIEWLLKDEIVSNLRNLHPITCDSLNYVSKHIQASAKQGKANVNVEQVPLQFVFGPDQSSTHFVGEFQKMNLQNYQLIKEGEWYYLARKRYSYISATMLSSALTDLSYGGPKGNSPKLQSPSTKSEASELGDTKYTKNLSPLIASQKDKMFDIGGECIGRSSPLTVKYESQTDPSKEQRRLSRESSLTLEKRTSAEGLNLENVSLINRRRSKDLVLKMMKGLGGEERRKSMEAVEVDEHTSRAETQTGPEDHATNDGILTEILKESTETISNGKAENAREEKSETDGDRIVKETEEGHVVEPHELLSDTKSRDSTASPTVLDLSNVSSPAFSQFSSPATSTPTVASAGTPRSGTESQLTSAVQSPVVSDISIQLIKTDGRCEPFRTSPERAFDKADNSYDSLEMENEGVLKRCSSFAGFHSGGSRVIVKSEDVPMSESGIQNKVPLQGPPGIEGRARHCSAPLSGHSTVKSRISTLPQTPSCISSRGSFAEDGLSYDGDQSEMDDSATIFSESGVVHRLMPSFWLIMQISSKAVDILFQHRETGRETNEETLQNRSLLAQVKANVENICRKVNQQLLLNDLYESRMCHTLLVDAADEDVSWKLDKGPRLKTRQHNMSSSENEDDEDDDTFERKYLAAAMDLDPGFFDCPCVWKTNFMIHPGLKRGSGRAAMSVGVTTLRSVLNPFSVNNRNNMFVIKESTGNVCYLRLKEIQSMSRPTTGVEDTTDITSMGGRKASTDVLDPGDKDVDTMSIGSSCSALSLSQSQRGPQDCVELHVHGIEEAGKEIREHLVQMLQNKLDEKTLDKICEMLRRNPLCQLEREDVQFIQRPDSKPSLNVQLTVNNKVSPHLGAVMYYLRQNLLQYLHPPRYKSAQTDSHFMDVFDGKLTAIPSDQAFLYIPSHTARKTGVACVSMCLVDGQGNQVKLLQCPQPLTMVEAEVQEQKDLEEFIVTQMYEAKPHSKKPGPTALIQFHVWECGDIDLPILQEKLTTSLKHALCDLVMEYHLLSAPICEIPKHLVDILAPPPIHSAPSSPFHCMPGKSTLRVAADDNVSRRHNAKSAKAEEFRERKFSMVALRKQSEYRQPDRRASLHNHSKLQSLKDALLQPTKKLMSPPPESTKIFEMPGQEICGTPSPRPSSPLTIDRSRSGSPRKEPTGLLSRYETGDMGTLHRVFSDVMENWLLYCCGLETPAVNKLELTLTSRFSSEYVLQELPNIVAQVSEGMKTRVFKMHPGTDKEEDANICVPYHPNRPPFEHHRRKSETSLDSPKQFLNLTPGEDRNFIVVGRNLDLWYKLMQHSVEEDGSEQMPTKLRGKLLGQKYEAHFPTLAESKSFGMFAESSYLIPRQTFIFILLKNKQMYVYTYNLTNEVFLSLSRNLGKLVQWNNARSQLLTSIVVQKCGFYNHFLFGDISSSLADNMDQLITNPAPPVSNKEKLTRTSSTHSVRETYLPFDVTFKDLYPKKPLHLSDLLCEGDPVRQFGKQAQYIRLEYKKEMTKMNSIGKLYVMWLQKSSPNYPIDEDTIRTLKQASRLFHYCATPLLFSAKWRQLILEKYKVTRQESVVSTVSSSNTPDTKSRSRHGSGTSTGSMRTKRTDSSELRKRPSLTTFKEVNVVEEACQEEEWHQELRSDFIFQYIKYLQSIGFNHVQMDKSQDKAKARKRNPKPEEQIAPQGEDNEIKAWDTHNLQKTVSGGILLIELCFRQEYFCVKLYTCDHNKLGITVNQQKSVFQDKAVAANVEDLKLLFVDECEKYKGLIHVHSFAHDFHLRYIQAYISGCQDLLKPGHYLSGLLTDFVKVYPYAPSFSRNFLLRDVVSIPEPTCSSEDLYDYMLKHANLHSMSVLKMVLPEHELEQESSLGKTYEHALISHEKREVNALDKTLSKKKLESYNIGLIILENTQHGDGDRGVMEKRALKLQFFIILTSSQDIFPRHSLEKDVLAKSKNADIRLEMPDLKQQIAIKQTPGLQTEMTNYLGYSNRHQPPMYQLLQAEATEVKAKIESMAVVSMDKCRRDCLWTKMLMGVDQAQDDKRKKRSDTEDSRDSFGRLTYEEFQELLTRVHKVPMHEMDAKLVHFLQMSPSWYQGLANVLNNKYAENVKRCYTNPENSLEKHLIIINPRCLDLVMLLSIDSNSGKTGLYAVYRKPAKEQECLFPGAQNLPEQSEQFLVPVFLVLCWTVFPSNQQAQYCTPYSASSPSPGEPKFPVLPDQFQTTIEGNFLDRNLTITVHEYFDHATSQAAVVTLANGTIHRNLYDYQNNQLFYIIGPKCTVTDLTYDNNNLIFGDLMFNHTVRIFTSGGALHFAKSFGEKYMGKTTVRGINVDHWQSCMYWDQVSSNFTLDYYFTAADWLDPVSHPQIPVRAVATGIQLTGQGVHRNFSHYYDYIDFKLNISDFTVFDTPTGVYCAGRKQVKPLPKLPKFFHYKLEILNSSNPGQISHTDVWYDTDHRLIRADSPIQQNRPPLNTNDPVSQITDYNYGITYFINILTKECKALPISANQNFGLAHSVTFSTNNGSQVVNMKTPQQLLFLDSTYSYTGQRTTRGVLCDVYSSLRTDLTVAGYNNVQAVFEYYFLADGLQKMPDYGRSGQQDVPVMLIITVEAMGLTLRFDFVSFDMEDSHSTFDISPCYSDFSKLQLQVKFYGQTDPSWLATLRLQAEVNLANATGVSQLRMQDIRVDYDESFVYVSASVLDRVSATAQFSHAPITDVHLPADKIYSYAQVSSVSDCATVCVQTQNFSCSNFDWCVDNRSQTCKLFKTSFSRNSPFLFPGTCDHYTRTVVAPAHPELNLTTAYNNLMAKVFSGQLFLLVFLETQINPISFKAIDVSIISGQFYQQSLPSLQAQFSYHLENSIPNIQTVFNSHIYYDYLYKLVRYDVIDGIPVTYIHDYNSGLAYTIDKQSQLCTVGPIGNHSFDVLAPSSAQVNKTGYVLQMRNPLQIFYLSNNYVYIGQKTVRTMTCDVYENVGKFSFGGTLKDAVFQFFFMSTGWHELSSDSGIPVPSQPISLIVTAVDGSELEHFDIYDFNQQHPDLSSFNIQPCFPDNKQSHFLIVFNQTYHPTLDHNLAQFQRNIQKQLSVISGVSPLRFQNPQITYQGQFTYYIATMVEQAPVLFDFTKTSNKVSLYSMDASFAGITSDAQCAGICRNMTSSSAFTCLSFDYCPSKQLCQLSRQRLPDGNKLKGSTTCDHYSRTVASKLSIEPTVEQAFTMFLDRIARGTLAVNVQVNATLVVKYPATFLDRNILRFDSGQASSETLSHFTLYKQKESFKNAVLTIKKVAVDDCANRCMTEITLDCQSFSYCYESGTCLLNNVHPAENNTNIENSMPCDLYARKYSDAFVEYAGQVIPSSSDTLIQNVGSADTCAQQCSLSTGFTCRSFDFCLTSQTCFIKRTHALDYSARLVTSASCSHYSKKFLYDFIRTPKRVLTFGKPISFFNVSMDNCAKICVENSGYQCKAFTYCAVDASCTIVSSKTNLVQSQIKPNNNCDLFTRQYFPEGPSVSTPSPPQSSQQHSSGYSGGAMAGVAVAMLLVGAILGAALLYYLRTRQLVERKLHYEMQVVKSQKLKDSDDC